MRPDSSLRYRRYINHLLTYLLTYLLCALKKTCYRKGLSDLTNVKGDAMDHRKWRTLIKDDV